MGMTGIVFLRISFHDNNEVLMMYSGLLLACAGDQDQLQQDVANLKIDSKRREIRLTKMLSSASQKTQSERELGQVSEAVLVQGDKGCRCCVTFAPCAICVHTRASYPLDMHVELINVL